LGSFRAFRGPDRRTAGRRPALGSFGALRRRRNGPPFHKNRNNLPGRCGPGFVRSILGIRENDLPGRCRVWVRSQDLILAGWRAWVRSIDFALGGRGTWVRFVDFASNRGRSWVRFAGFAFVVLGSVSHHRRFLRSLAHPEHDQFDPTSLSIETSAHGPRLVNSVPTRPTRLRVNGCSPPRCTRGRVGLGS
jgi:hypothetical protein